MGAQHGPHSPSVGVTASHMCLLIAPKPLPGPTLSLPLQLPGPGPDLGHLAFVGFQQLLRRLLLSLQWERLPGGLSLWHTGFSGKEGPAHSPGAAAACPGIQDSPYLHWQPARGGFGRAEQGPLVGGQHIPQGSSPRPAWSLLSPHSWWDPTRHKVMVWLSVVRILGHSNLADTKGRKR